MITSFQSAKSTTPHSARHSYKSSPRANKFPKSLSASTYDKSRKSVLAEAERQPNTQHTQKNVSYSNKILRMNLLKNLKSSLSVEHLASAEKTAEKLLRALPFKDNLEKNNVMILCGGGKDSTWALAYTRLTQLIIEEKEGQTFNLRVGSGRHPGMQFEVMENLDNAYQALGIGKDPLTDPFIIYGNKIEKFDLYSQIPPEIEERDRTDILVNGHLFEADARRTFCDSCNRNLGNFIGISAGYTGNSNEASHILITGDSATEQKAYYGWIIKMALKFGASKEELKKEQGFTRVLKALDHISMEHTKLIHGDDDEKTKEVRRVYSQLDQNPQFFSIYDDTSYEAGDHLEFLTNDLKFSFDSLMFSFTESDCGNPALMAHTYGLAAERKYNSTYEDGVKEYRDFALDLMKDKNIPEPLIKKIEERYDNDEAIKAMRSKVETYAKDAYNFTEAELVCMVHAPFLEKGKNLDRFITSEYPEMQTQIGQMRELLEGRGENDNKHQKVIDFLEGVSGLTLKQIQKIYASQHVQNPVTNSLDNDPNSQKLQRLWLGDPHQKIIKSRFNDDGEEKKQLITGR